MRKVLLLLIVAAVLAVGLARSQDGGKIPSYLAFDGKLKLQKEFFKKQCVDLSASCYDSPTEYLASVYSAGGSATISNPYLPNVPIIPDYYPPYTAPPPTLACASTCVVAQPPINLGTALGDGELLYFGPNDLYALEVFYFDAKGNGKIDPGEWLDVNGNGAIDNGEWKDGGIVYMKMYKRIESNDYKEIEYSRLIFPKMDPHVVNIVVNGVSTPVLFFRLEMCEYCDIVGDVAYYEDEFTRIMFNFQGITRVSEQTKIGECEGCYTATLTYYVKFQVYVHENYEMIFDSTWFHNQEPRPLIETGFVERHTESVVNGSYDSGEGIVRDLDNSGTVSNYDVVVSGTAPIGSGLINFTSLEKYTDGNHNIQYDSGESVIRDVDDNFRYSAGDVVISGTAPSSGSPLLPFKSSAAGSGYYYTYEEEKDDEKWGITQVIPFDPYYLTITDQTDLTLFEVEGGKSLILPKTLEQEKYGYVTRWSDTNGNGIREPVDCYMGIRLVDIFRIKTHEHEEVMIAKILVTPVESTDGFVPKTGNYKIYTVYFTPDDNKFRNEIIFPDIWIDANNNRNIDAGEMAHTDFGFIVTKMDAEKEKIWLKFIQRVDKQTIPIDISAACPSPDVQAVFDLFDRSRAVKCCEFPLKRIDKVPLFSRILVDIVTQSSSLVNSTTLLYQDLKGDISVKQNLEEQPHAFDQTNTRVTAIDIRKFISNVPGPAPAPYVGNPGGAFDFSGLGWAGPPNAAPGVVFTGNDPTPNWQVSDKDFSGTAVPGDLLTFWIYVRNASLLPMIVNVTDVVPGNVAPIPFTQIFNGGICTDTDNSLTCDTGEIIRWNNIVVPAGGSVTLAFQGSVPGNASYGSVVANSAIINYCEFGSYQTLMSDPVTVKISAMQLVKQAYSLGPIPPAGTPIQTIVENGTYQYRIYYYVTTAVGPGVTSTATSPLQIEDAVPIGVSYNLGSASVNPPGPPYIGPPWFSVVLPIPGGTNPTIDWQVLPSGTALASGNWGYVNYNVTVNSPPTTYTILNDATITYLRNIAPDYPPDSEVSIWDNTHQQNEVAITTATGSQIFAPSGLDPQTACVTDVTLDKTTSNRTVAPGLPITYKIQFTNSGQGPYADIYNIVVADRVPDGIDMTTVVLNASGGAASGIIGFIDVTARTITWYIPSMKAGQSGSVSWTGTVLRDIIVNNYLVRVYSYDMYEKTKEGEIETGGILGDGFMKVTPDDIAKVTSDSIFTQVYEESRRVDRYNLPIYERKVYDGLYAMDFTNVDEEKKSAFFELFSRVRPDLGVSLHWAVYGCTTCDVESNDIKSGDEFLLHVLMGNAGSGLARDFNYTIDASAFAPQEVTWVYDTENKPPLQQPELIINPGESAALLFKLKAPEVRNETTYPVIVRLTWKDELGKIYKLERKVFINVQHEKRGQVEIIKHIVEGKNKTVSDETKTEKVSLNVGEKRTIHVYLRNTSDNKISGIRYIEVPPKGISIVEGSREWKGSLDPGQTADFIFKIEAIQTGTYNLLGHAIYEQAGQLYDAAGNTIEISVVGEKGPTVEKETDVIETEKEGIVSVVIKVANDTKRVFKNIQVIEVLPKGFTVDEILTKELIKKEGLLTYQISELSPGKYILLKYTLRAGPMPGIYSFLGTRAVYDDSSKVKQEITSTDSELTILEEAIPSLAIEIEAQEREPLSSQEENVTMVVKLTNEGGIEARDVKFVLPIPETTQLIEASGTPLTPNGGLAYTIDYINPGDTYVIKYTFRAMHTVEDRKLKIDLEAKYTDEFKREYSLKKDTTLVIEAKKPVVKMSRTFDKNILKINYPLIASVTLTNEGDSSATVNFKDEFPEGFAVMTGQNLWSGTLKPGDTITLTYEIMANRVGIYQLGTTAKATFKATSGTEYAATLTEDDAQKLTVMGILVSKTVDRQKVFVDEIAVVTVTIQNIYKEKASAIHVTDTIPQGTELIEGATEWSIENLEPDEKTVYTYSLKFMQEGDVTLPPIKASFKDVYGDMHETLSEKALVSVTYPEGKKPTPPPVTTTPPPETKPPARIFKPEFFWIIIIVGIILVAGMVAILFIEQRRTAREEEKERIEQLTPEQLRAELWRRGAEERKELPAERKRPPREGLPPKAFRGEEEVEEKKPSFLDRILGRKPEAGEEEEARAPPILKEEEKEAPKAIGERMEAERIRKERAREITGVTDIREVMEGREEEMSDLERLIYGERLPREEVKEKGPAPRDILKDREEKKEAPPARPVQKEEEYVVPSIIEKFRKKEEVEEPKSLRELIEEKGAEPEKRDIKEIKRPSYLERILAREKEEVPTPREEEKPRRRLDDILKRAPVEKKPKIEEEKEEEEDELPDPKDLLKKNGNGKNGEKK